MYSTQGRSVAGNWIQACCRTHSSLPLCTDCACLRYRGLPLALAVPLGSAAFPRALSVGVSFAAIFCISVLLAGCLAMVRHDERCVSRPAWRQAPPALANAAGHDRALMAKGKSG